MRLHNKLILFISLLVFITSISYEILFRNILTDVIKNETGSKALTIAQMIADLPDVKKAFYEDNPSAILQPLAEQYRVMSDAEYVVIGNTEEVRYAHPKEERIGQKMVGGDNEAVLRGESIISSSIGSLGPSLRGKTPVFGEGGNIIGIVSVGFLNKEIAEDMSEYHYRMIRMSIILLSIAVIGAVLIAYKVKRSLFGYEPERIAHLYEEKQAILESVREGIIAVNKHGIITLANSNALTMLQVPKNEKIEGKFILNVLPNSHLIEVVRTGKKEYDEEMLLHNEVVIVNRFPIYGKQKRIIGAVASFRYKSEINRLSRALSNIKKYAEGLRAQTHEYSNKLHTISGLIQLKSYQEAIEYITKESDITQNIVHFLMKAIPDPMLAGLLIGKLNQASESKVHLVINEDSTFQDVPSEISRDDLITIIGNIIDNAIESVLDNEEGERLVEVFFTDLGTDLIIEVDDNGAGIPKELEESVFEIGFSTKMNRGNSGFGLPLVKQAVTKLNGYITYSQSHLKGANFTIVIPKKGERTWNKS
ncbi:ATP-binding protein [Priestia taiwanensis]|uniref:histidine kinase n=1 Tax=Priestia taiwanensis TaxID=1347902 RepID=A0A917ALP2_9BACI|nr:sensor histidine kinase [Priestia taiwanensis]MBM7362196.1 two-component system CitB family sensor kinase [Priestia taiwanensis]GGE60159.1 sensor histidine kinase [Priestia taiwanensis]